MKVVNSEVSHSSNIQFNNIASFILFTDKLNEIKGTSGPQLVHQRLWYVFYLWESAYKRSLAAYWKE